MQLSVPQANISALPGPVSALPRGPLARPGALPARARTQRLHAANPLINLLASGICVTVPAGIAVVTAKVRLRLHTLAEDSTSTFSNTPHERARAVLGSRQA